jgi:hypothetical protein
MDQEEFWLKDPSVLISNLTVIPNHEMTVNEKLNALTRLLFVTCLGLHLLEFNNTFIILGAGLLLVVAVYSQQEYNKPKKTENFKPETSNSKALDNGIRGFVPNFDSRPQGPQNKACWFDQDTGLINAKNEIKLPIQFNHYDDSKRSYMNAGYELNPQYVEPDFQAVWRNDPSMFGGYSMVPDPESEFPVEYPEGEQSQVNYIVRSKIDHLPTSQVPNGLIATRAMAEQAFLQGAMDFRDGLLNEHIDRFVRERQHNCPDMPLNRATAGGGNSV